MSRPLPAVPNIEHLKKEAKALLRAARRADADAVARFTAMDVSIGPSLKLADAQHALAREYGFSNWTTLKQHVLVQASDADPFAALGAAVDADDVAAASRILGRHPSLARRLNDALPNGSFGSTALIHATNRKSLPMIDLLLRAGADIDAKSHWWAGGFRPLDSADPSFAPELVARGARVDLYAAARLGRMDDVERWLHDDPEAVHSRGGDGHTPLHVAANVDVARLLVDHGANVDALDVDHESTPAMYAIRERTDVARFLISRGCSTDILMAAAVGDLDLVRVHLDRDPESIRTTVSPAFFPMRNPRAGGTIYIWTLGAHKSPHMVARDFGHEDVLELLMSRTPDSLKVALAAELGDEARLRALLARQPGLLDTLGDDEMLKLLTAAERNDTASVRLMLGAGWKPDIRRADGLTALHWSGFHGNADMARDLVAHGAPVDMVETRFGGTPLGWTLHGSMNGWHRASGDYPSTCAVLLDAGASLPPIESIDASEPVMALLRARGVDV